MADTKVNEATRNLIQSLRETNQAIVDSIVAAQERNMKFAQSIFENGTEVLKSHAEGTRSLMQTTVEQPQQEGVFQAVADSAVAALERNMKFAQSTFENGIEVLKSHAEGTRSLTQTIVEQSQQQREAFQMLVRESVDAYMSFFSTPFSYYQQALDAADAAARQGLETFEKATRQGLENIQKVTRQAQNAVQDAAK